MSVQQITRKRDNCLKYALRVFRYESIANWLQLRKSKHAWFPHFTVIFELDGGEILCRREYVPDKARPRWCPPWLFEGHVNTTYYKRVSHDDA